MRSRLSSAFLEDPLLQSSGDARYRRQRLRAPWVVGLEGKSGQQCRTFDPLISRKSTLPSRPGGPIQREATGIKAGAVLDSRFQIEATIGEGGSGQVFRAWDRVLGEPIALKILRPDRAKEKSWIKRLAREVKVARAIRHPNVCRVFDLGKADGHWFVSMELAPGGTLRDTLTAGKARGLAERLADARAVSAGLAAIHMVGITHRDVTPQNVLRMGDGHLVLSDFGLAIEGADTTVHGGTPRYMAPETAMGQRLGPALGRLAARLDSARAPVRSATGVGRHIQGDRSSGADSAWRACLAASARQALSGLLGSESDGPPSQRDRGLRHSHLRRGWAVETAVRKGHAAVDGARRRDAGGHPPDGDADASAPGRPPARRWSRCWR